MMGPSYCVICTYDDFHVIRVVGPFATQEAAVEWAHMMRGANRAWTYVPEVMDAPTTTETAA